MSNVVAKEILRPLRLPGYAFLSLTILLQAADFIIAVAPFRLSAIMWRFSALAGASANIGNVLLLLLLLYVFALLLQDSAGLATVVGLASILAIVLVGCGFAFTLDAIQLRTRVDPSVVHRFDLAAVEAILKFLTQGIVSSLMAFSALRSWRLSKRQYMLRGERPLEDAGVLIRSITPAPPRVVQD
jgi:hypothetical protein